MDKESITFMEWLETLTVSGFVNVLLLVSFGLLIAWMVARTFRGKSDV